MTMFLLPRRETCERDGGGEENERAHPPPLSARPSGFVHRLLSTPGAPWTIALRPTFSLGAVRVQGPAQLVRSGDYGVFHVGRARQPLTFPNPSGRDGP